MSESASIDPETPLSVTPTPNDQNEVLEQVIKEEGENKDASSNRLIDVEKAKSTFQEKAKSYLIDQTNHIVIPSFSRWFSMNKIHDIEKKSFPDFFPSKEGEKSKSIYKDHNIYRNMRDFMINTYRINPLEYLTVTAVRRNLAGDVTTILRIHRFLEKWGLINYQIDPRTRPTLLGPQYAGHFVVTLDTPRGLVPFIPENMDISDESITNIVPNSVDSEAPKPKDEEAAVNEKPAIPINAEIRTNVYLSANEGPGLLNQNIVQYFCNTCNNETSDVRYHNLKNKSYTSNPNSTVNNASILCTSCYEQGLFPSNFKSSDFIKLSKNQDTSKWTEQETLLLLEGIEMFGTFDVNSNATNVNLNSNANGQWEKIAEFVGTKTKEQCLSRFLQLPIEEKYLTKLMNPQNQKEIVDKQELIKDIVEEIITNENGKELLRENSIKTKNEVLLEQSNIVNQIMELTLQKVNEKLQSVSELEKNLLQIESALNLERKQVMLERWSNFEKIQKFSEAHPNMDPDMQALLKDLQKPISSVLVHKLTNPASNGESKVNVDNSNEAAFKEAESLPISVVNPKSYQYWTA